MPPSLTYTPRTPMSKNVLHLTLKRQWFDAIAAGVKTEEYREMSQHWRRNLGKHLEAPPWKEIHFRNGYRTDAPFMRVRFAGLRVGYHRGRQTYILTLGRILEITGYEEKASP